MTRPTSITRKKRPSWRPFAATEPHRVPGKLETMEVKISSDMPLPTPRSVMSSPIHMTRPVPAVMVTTMISKAGSDSSGMIEVHWPPNSWSGLRA